MSFVPNMVNPDYSLLMTRETFTGIKDLKFPEDGMKIARLNLTEKQVWLAAQDPQGLIDHGSNERFNKFWFRYYLLPLKIKRFVYKFKFWSTR